MIEITNGAIFKLFLLDTPRFVTLNEIFPDGIPVFYVRKGGIPGVRKSEYSWKVDMNLLSSEQKHNLTYWYVSYSGIPIDVFEKNGIFIPDTIIRQVLAANGDQFDTKFIYLSQIATRKAVRDETIIHMSLSMVSLHFICLACIRLFTSREFEGYGNDILSHHIPHFIDALSTGDEEVREFYEHILNNSVVVEVSKDS